jgi:hypothetical protein
MFNAIPRKKGGGKITQQERRKAFQHFTTKCQPNAKDDHTENREKWQT